MYTFAPNNPITSFRKQKSRIAVGKKLIETE